MPSGQTDIPKLAESILKGDRLSLSRGITLCESSLSSDREKTALLLEIILPHTGKSVRIGISGVPGAGKSTFIEASGLFLLSIGKKVAVLAVDPSSSRSGGSIMGDKTRMQELSKNPAAYIRPSSTGKTLGGIAAATREAILLCEAAGFDTILIETTGVGQSETLVHEMTDHFVLLLLTGAGDEIQLMKKGIMELADTVVINKAEEGNLQAARQLKNSLRDRSPSLPVHLVSSLQGSGIGELWKDIEKSLSRARKSSSFSEKRKMQNVSWMHHAIRSTLEDLFYRDPRIQKKLRELEGLVKDSELPATAAALKLLEIFTGK